MREKCWRICGSYVVTMLVTFYQINLLNAQQQDNVHKRYEYKHSFRTPKLAQQDGTVAFWEISGDALASSEQLRLAPSMRSRRGAIWNKKPFVESEWWEVEITFKVAGQGRIGADGLAFWYTAQKGQLGPVFGSNDYWTGAGLLFDSFDNDNQRNNPYIMAMINDGTRSYDHQTDGSGQMLSGCQKDFRNRVFPVKARITYLNNVLTVLVHDGMTQVERWELCIRAENVFLPKNGFFGLSATTGGLADDHDVLAFNAFSLHTNLPAAKPNEQLPVADREKFEKEFADMWTDFEKEKEKFRREHPDKASKADDGDNGEEFAKYFEDATARELRLIYESQNSIHQVLVQFEAKMNDILHTQQQQMPLIQRAAQGGGGQAVAPSTGTHQQQQGQAQQVIDTFQRHEVNELMDLARQMSQQIKDVKNYATDIYTRTYQMESKLNNMPQGVGTVQQAGGAPVDTHTLNTLIASVDAMRNDLQHVRSNQNQPPPAAMLPNDCPICLGSTVFLAVICVQSLVLIAVVFLKKGQDKAKFY